eukprot:6220420-Amphidinium_carterae.2
MYIIDSNSKRDSNAARLSFQCGGEWHQDMKSGRGKETWLDGSSFNGIYKQGRKNGLGLFVSADNSTFEGPWQQSCYFKNYPVCILVSFRRFSKSIVVAAFCPFLSSQHESDVVDVHKGQGHFLIAGFWNVLDTCLGRLCCCC